MKKKHIKPVAEGCPRAIEQREPLQGLLAAPEGRGTDRYVRGTLALSINRWKQREETLLMISVAESDFLKCAGTEGAC